MSIPTPADPAEAINSTTPPYIPEGISMNNPMQSKFIRISELASVPGRNGRPARHGRLPVSCATIWRWVKLGEFPQPVRLGPQVTAWRMHDIEQWENEHASWALNNKVQHAMTKKWGAQ